MQGSESRGGQGQIRVVCSLNKSNRRSSSPGGVLRSSTDEVSPQEKSRVGSSHKQEREFLRFVTTDVCWNAAQRLPGTLILIYPEFIVLSHPNVSNSILELFLNPNRFRITYFQREPLLRLHCHPARGFNKFKFQKVSRDLDPYKTC